ncbi:MAG: hypothetical protein A3E79_00255 [Burkholderiales bacterium RIFCSPHIGHO2_12_FULL_61_11]|nr:MAG: hypothetical protein A3E79_00255 [Burkholderiales bacterium RIFCSPHIGHO2_12_FULL_61_11]
MKSTHNTLWAYSKTAAVTLAVVSGTVGLLAACSGIKPPPKEYSQVLLDNQIQVPPGNVVALETTATGLLNYQCKSTGTSTTSWVLVSSQTDLVDRTGKQVAKYAGPPAIWTHMDGSSVMGAQMDNAPRLGATNINNQLYRAKPGPAAGVLQNVSYIQRIKTKGGQDLSKACTQIDMGDKLTRPYQADYIFWKAA